MSGGSNLKMTGQGLVLPTFISYLVSVAVSAIPKMVVIVSAIHSYLYIATY